MKKQNTNQKAAVQIGSPTIACVNEQRIANVLRLAKRQSQAFLLLFVLFIAVNSSFGQDAPYLQW